MSEALISASINPQYDKRLFMDARISASEKYLPVPLYQYNGPVLKYKRTEYIIKQLSQWNNTVTNKFLVPTTITM